MPTAGDLVGGRYRLDGRIASGGMGDVWRATDTVLGRGVAVKMLLTRSADDPGFQSRFRHEARAMAMLHHPGVADVYDYGETADGESSYIVMAHIDGQPLDRRLAEGGRLEAAETMSIVAQAARALHAAHTAGIVHRDVKPGNLIVQPDGTVVLVDFGVARSAGSTIHTGVNEVVGTARYIAPEQVSKQRTGPATDIYALGAVAYHCLAGQPPFPGDNPLSVALSHLDEDPPPLPADVPARVRDLVMTAMAKDPADRFASAAAMAGAADAAAGAGIDDTLADQPFPGPAPDDGAATTAIVGGAAVPVAAGGGPRGSADGPATAAPVRAETRRRPRALALGLLALAVAGVVLSLGATGLFSPDTSDPPTTPGRSPGSGGIGQVTDPGGGAGGERPGSERTAGDDDEAEPTPGATDAADPDGTDGSEPGEPDPADPEPTTGGGGPTDPGGGAATPPAPDGDGDGDTGGDTGTGGGTGTGGSGTGTGGGTGDTGTGAGTGTGGTGTGGGTGGDGGAVTTGDQPVATAQAAPDAGT